MCQLSTFCRNCFASKDGFFGDKYHVWLEEDIGEKASTGHNLCIVLCIGACVCLSLCLSIIVSCVTFPSHGWSWATVRPHPLHERKQISNKKISRLGKTVHLLNNSIWSESRLSKMMRTGKWYQKISTLKCSKNCCLFTYFEARRRHVSYPGQFTLMHVRLKVQAKSSLEIENIKHSPSNTSILGNKCNVNSTLN